MTFEQPQKGGVERRFLRRAQFALAICRDDHARRAAQYDTRGAEVERAQLAALLAQRRRGKLSDRGDEAADKVSLLWRAAVELPARHKRAAAALQKQNAGDARLLRFGQRQLAHRLALQRRAQPQLEAVGRGQLVEPLIQIGNEIAEGVGDGGGDEPAGDRVQRLDHHVLGVFDLAADNRDNQRRDRVGEFAVARHFRPPQRLRNDFGRRGLKSGRIADIAVKAVKLGADARQLIGFRTNQQGLQTLKVRRQRASLARHVSRRRAARPAS